MIHLLTDPLYLLALCLPAWLVHRLIRPTPTTIEATSEVLLLTVTLVPIPVFTLALITRSYLSPAWLLGGAALITALALTAHLRQSDADLAVLKDRLLTLAPATPGTRPALLLALLVFALFLVNYDRRHFQYGCINGVVMQALTPEAAGAYDPHGDRDSDAAASVDWGQPDHAPNAAMNLIDVHGTGQRLGTTAVIAPIVALFDVLGFRLIYAALPVLILLFGFRLADALIARPRLALLAAALALLNPYVLKIVILDENVMAFAFTTASLALLVGPRRPADLLLAGLAFGAALGIRHLDLPFGLLALALIGRRWPSLLRFALPALLFVTPCLLHHHFTYGGIFRHEHFVDEVFLSVPHTILGYRFNYTGLLNWPFYDHLIRTPYNPYPTLLYYPLSTLAHLGTAVCALALVGATRLLYRPRRLLWALSLWLIPQYAVLAVLENWMDPNKMGIIITLFPALIVTLALGLGWLAQRPRRWLYALLTTAALSALALSAHSLTVPDDPRFYTKYPRVRHERPAYLNFERDRIATGDPLPSLYLLQQYTPLDLADRLHMLAQDLLDRRHRRPAPPIAASTTRPVTLTFNFERPLIESLDFLSAPPSSPAPAIDATPANTQIQINGFRAWDAQPLDVLIARNATHQLDLYLRFGDDGFADVSSDRLFTIEQRPRPALETRQTDASSLTLTVRDGDHIRLLETISLDEVLVYRWDIHVQGGTATLSLPAKMFHN